MQHISYNGIIIDKMLSLIDFYNLPLKQYVTNSVITIQSKASVHEAVELMSQKNVGCLVALYENNRYGILTERDIIKEYAMELYDFQEQTVGDIMTVSPIVVQIKDSVGLAFEIMNKNKIRHLPVLEDEKLVGIVSIRDLTRALVENLPSKKERQSL